MAEFNGTIGITKEDSISSYKPEKSLNNRPNIMYIVLDDIGFAAAWMLWVYHSYTKY